MTTSLITPSGSPQSRFPKGQWEKIKRDIEDDSQEKVKLAIVDIDGVLRGKMIHRDKFFKVIEGGLGFCDVVFGWDMADQCYDNSSFTGWHTGYPDAQARLDLNSYRKIPWQRNIPFFLGDFVANSQGDPLPIDPRQLLKTVVAKAKSMGFLPVAAQEFEWFNFLETSDQLHQKDFRQLTTLTKGMFGYSIIRSSQNSAYFQDLFDSMRDFDIPLEGLHTETGPGVYEAAIFYAHIMEAADRATLFKTAVKEIAHRHGVIPSFMAKWSDQYPGCSGHIHLSLWDLAGERNLFHQGGSSLSGLSAVGEHFLAGLLHCLPNILPLFAPTVNSYKRLVEGAWAPTTLTWGKDNRTTAVRVLAEGEKSARLEFRVPGSDCNPYLAFAGTLAAGLYGIENQLPLKIKATQGNGYADKSNGVLPSNLFQATTEMENSPLAKELFGAEFVQHFTKSRHWEWRSFQKSVTNWELQRYFELI